MRPRSDNIPILKNIPWEKELERKYLEIDLISNFCFMLLTYIWMSMHLTDLLTILENKKGYIIK